MRVLSATSAPKFPGRLDPSNERQKYLKRLEALRSERNSWRAHWKDLSDYILPRGSRFLSSERNKGEKKSASLIVNGTATHGQRVLAAGMMAGITSPARTWFRLTTRDPALSEFGPVKEWLHMVEGRIFEALAKSNVYNALHQVYGGLGVFGTQALLIEDDPVKVLRAYHFPLGQFFLANSDRLQVDTCYRELSMTVGQLVGKFGYEKCSVMVQGAYDRGNVDLWVDVLHAIAPNHEQVMGRLGYEGMAWKSCWLEVGAAGRPSSQASADEGILREGGYEEFPVLCPRWEVTGEDVYGSSPGMESLGDVRALQLLEKRKMEGFDKIVRPPMVGPKALEGQRATLLPGDVTYVDALGPGQTFRPAMEVNPAAMTEFREAIREHEQRISTVFYADLWLMMATTNNPDMTAREVAERHEEKMLQLGPVMERLQNELLDPLIDRVFNILLRNGDLPPAPEEMSGMEIKVDYLSIMAQAQKMLGIGAIERLFAFGGNMAAVKPEALDKLDFDQALDEYGAMVGVPPALIRTDEAVAQLREARAQQQQAMQAQEQAANAVQGAKTLSETDVQGDNGLTRLLGNLGPGYGALAGKA